MILELVEDSVKGWLVLFANVDFHLLDCPEHVEHVELMVTANGQTKEKVSTFIAV